MGKVFVCFLLLVYIIKIGASIRIDVDQMLQIENRFNYIEERLDSEAKMRRDSVQAILHKLYDIGDKIDQQNAPTRQTIGQDTRDKAQQSTREKAQHVPSNMTDLIHALLKAFETEKRINKRSVEHIESLLSASNTKTTFLENKIQTKEKRAQRHLEMLETSLSDIKQSNHDILKNIEDLDEVLIDLKNSSEISSREILDRLDYNSNSCALSSNKTETKIREHRDEMTKFKSCLELYKNGFKTSGVYAIYPDSKAPPLRVYCDQDTDGGGWIVFQRREDGSVNFYRNWINYEVGFGDLEGEFWLGNENLHVLTVSCCHELRIDMEDFENNNRYAKYSNFRIGSKAHNYMLTVEGYVGDAGDGFSYHSNMAFSTFDKDHDQAGNCALAYKGAWWYKKCHISNLNGQYLRGEHESHADGINWHPWRGYEYSLKKTEMKFRSSHVFA